MYSSQVIGMDSNSLMQQNAHLRDINYQQSQVLIYQEARICQLEEYENFVAQITPSLF